MNRHHTSSRLARIEAQKTVRTAIFSVFVIFVVIGCLVYFGIPLLIKMAVFVSEIRPPSSSQEIKNEAVISKPVLDAIPEATADPNIKITGYTQPGLVVTIVLNGNRDKENLADPDGAFQITLNLAKGENTILAYASDSQNNQSPVSNELNISYDDEAPALEIISPANNSELTGAKNKIVEIQGKTEPRVSVTLNSRFTMVAADGAFSNQFELHEGDNQFTALAKDKAGNETQLDFTLRWHP